MSIRGFTIAGRIDEVFAVLEALGELRIFKKYPVVEVMTRIEKQGGKSNDENEHEQN